MNGNQVVRVAARAEPERDVICGLEVVLADGVRSLGGADINPGMTAVDGPSYGPGMVAAPDRPEARLLLSSFNSIVELRLRLVMAGKNALLAKRLFAVAP